MKKQILLHRLTIVLSFLISIQMTTGCKEKSGSVEYNPETQTKVNVPKTDVHTAAITNKIGIPLHSIDGGVYMVDLIRFCVWL